MFQFKLKQSEKERNRVLESHIYIFNHCECHNTDDFNSSLPIYPEKNNNKSTLRNP